MRDGEKGKKREGSGRQLVEWDGMKEEKVFGKYRQINGRKINKLIHR